MCRERLACRRHGMHGDHPGIHIGATCEACFVAARPQRMYASKGALFAGTARRCGTSCVGVGASPRRHPLVQSVASPLLCPSFLFLAPEPTAQAAHGSAHQGPHAGVAARQGADAGPDAGTDGSSGQCPLLGFGHVRTTGRAKERHEQNNKKYFLHGRSLSSSDSV